MATAAFKSTTKRMPIGSSSTAEDAGSSSRAGVHRRSRSLSRYSGRVSQPDSELDRPAPRGRFVNTVRGSGFPEISLDDLADEFFAVNDDIEGGRSGRRVSSAGLNGDAPLRRGRSVSRSNGKGNNDCNVDRRGVPETYSRRRRSVSVARHQHVDSESDRDPSLSSNGHDKTKNFVNANQQRSSICYSTIPNNQRGLRRSLSQVDLLPVHDGYSSYSSALTDDEVQDAHQSGQEKTIRAVYAQKKSEHPCGENVEIGLFEAMRKEVRHAVHEIRTELEQVIVKRKPTTQPNQNCLQSDSSDAVQGISEIRKSYTMKLEQSEKRKQELLAELAVEEQRSSEISRIVGELIPEAKQISTPEKPTRARKRSNDRNRMTRKLTEEAEKYFEDFISNVEETDFSSIDGDRSDASSTFGGSTRSKDASITPGKTEIGGTPQRAPSVPVEMEGLVLPWLQWETSNDNSPFSFKGKDAPGSCMSGQALESVQESTGDSGTPCFTTSLGSWSPACCKGSAISENKTVCRVRSRESMLIPQMLRGLRGSSFDVTEYNNLQHDEDLLVERWLQRDRIDYGGLILCSRRFL